ALQRGPESRARSKRRSSAMSSEAAGLRILLVDDSKPLRRQLSRSLERLGATVSTAVDGADALQVIGTTKDQIHVILCDLSMPVMDGPGLASALRTAGVLRKLRGSADGTSQPPAMPFVLSTVKADFKVPQPGVEGGPSAVESSPSSQASRALTPTGSTRDASGLPPSDIGSTTELTGTVALKATASSSGGELAALFPGLAFVGLTGNGVQEDLVRFRQAGAHLVLTKPSSAKDIIASAARVLLALHAELG
ncbi:pilG, partial [Symbiodinium sp. KB8]